jgi:hypothetical protein
MQLLEHGENFTNGIRVLMLLGRNKDGCENKRTKLVVSQNSVEFREHLEDLCEVSTPGQRIYASLARRDLQKAIRLFKERQLQADYSETQHFYANLNKTWVSCLMNEQAATKKEKFWLIDCDTFDEFNDVVRLLGDNLSIYEGHYKTKNGFHVIVKPFNLKMELPIELHALVNRNPMMLWGY